MLPSIFSSFLFLVFELNYRFLLPIERLQPPQQPPSLSPTQKRKVPSMLPSIWGSFPTGVTLTCSPRNDAKDDTADQVEACILGSETLKSGGYEAHGSGGGYEAHFTHRFRSSADLCLPDVHDWVGGLHCDVKWTDWNWPEFIVCQVMAGGVPIKASLHDSGHYSVTGSWRARSTNLHSSFRRYMEPDIKRG